MWRHGHPRWPRPGAGHHQEEEPLPPDGGHSDLVSVPDQGVRGGGYQGKLCSSRSVSLDSILLIPRTSHNPGPTGWPSVLSFTTSSPSLLTSNPSRLTPPPTDGETSIWPSPQERSLLEYLTSLPLRTCPGWWRRGG